MGGGDGFYGMTQLRYRLDDGERYILDIHSVQCVYLSESFVRIFLKKKPGKGRPPCRYQSDIKGITAEALIREYEGSERKEYCFRRGTKGEKRRKVIVEGEVHTGTEKIVRQEKRN